MTQRERIPDDEPRANIYTTPDPVSAYATDTQPADEVRWGPVVAGIFSALTTLLTLSVLGLAIGLSTYDTGDPASAFGIGAGIWSVISALIAFGVGGYVAGATARVRGGDRGILNGAMVWMVTIPLALYLLGIGVGGLFGIATNAATAAGTAAGQAADSPAVQATAQAAGQAAQGAIENVPPDQVNQAVDNAGRTAWSTLLWLGLGAAAAIGGGYAGGRSLQNNRQTVARA